MPQKILTDDEWTRRAHARRRAGPQAAQGGRAPHALQPPATRSPAITEARDGQAVRARHHRAQPERAAARRQRQRRDDDSCSCKRLGHVNVHPYYVYMHDLVKGVEDLRTTLQTGARHREGTCAASTAGFNTPTFVVDAPGGGGKRDAHSLRALRPRRPASRVFTAPGGQARRAVLLLRSDRPAAARGPGALGRPRRARRHGRRSARRGARIAPLNSFPLAPRRAGEQAAWGSSRGSGPLTSVSPAASASAPAPSACARRSSGAS